MKVAFPIEKVANKFIELAALEGRLLTHMQLQKLVYFAHGIALGLWGYPLVANNFYAWKHGPVAPHLYEQLKDRSDQPIADILPDKLNYLELDDKAIKIICQTYAAYGQFDGRKLRNIARLPHSPWSVVSMREQYGQISDELTQKYYQQLLNTLSSSKNPLTI